MRILFGIVLLSSTTLLLAEDNASKLQKVQRQITLIEQSINRYKGERATEYKQLRKMEEGLASLTQQQRQSSADIATANRQLAKLNRQYRQLLPQKQAQELSIRSELQVAYRMGKQDRLKLLLNQDSAEQIARMLQYYQYIGKARSEKIDAYLATMSEINAVVDTIEQQKINLGQLQADQHRQRQALLSSQRQRETVVTTLNGSINSASERLKIYQRQSTQLQQLIESVLQITDIIEVPPKANIASVKGKLSRPIIGTVTNRYNSERIGSLKWSGVFVKAQEGSNVHSVYYGQVVFSGYLRGLGLLVIIDHGNDYLSLYGHNQILKVKVGNYVIPNQIIALAGNTGGQQQAGLYFEFRYKGKTHNPLSWVQF